MFYILSIDYHNGTTIVGPFPTQKKALEFGLDWEKQHDKNWHLITTPKISFIQPDLL